MKSRIYMTSDEHYHHANILKYCSRPFETVEQMDQALIDEHNKVVKDCDTVYHLGDFTFQPITKVVETLKQLNGSHMFIQGNHDHWFDESDATLKALPNKKYLGRKMMHEFKQNGVTVVLCHYPMVTWNKAFRDSLQFYGHCHSKMEDKYNRGKQMDVGVDNAYKLLGQYRPFSFEEARDMVKDRQRTETISD